MLRLNVVFFLVCLRYVECGNNFLGGVISYTFIDNYTAEVEVITSWTIGHGLCGTGCSNGDVDGTPVSVPPGTSMLPDYGQFSLSSHHTSVNGGVLDITSNTLMTQVIAVSESAQWEQNLVQFRIDVNASQTLTLQYTGQYWKTFPYYQRQDLPWKLSSSINTDFRNDTHKPNSSPKILLRPYYKVKWNDTTFIHLTTTDGDGDYIKCQNAIYKEAGGLSFTPGIQVYENCTVQIDAFDYHGYQKNTWNGVPIVLRDYNKDTLAIGTNILHPVSYSISTVQVQFAIYIMDGVFDSPEFVEPTPSSGQKYVVYQGSEWNVRVCARGSDNNNIEEFVTTSVDTLVTLSVLQPGKDIHHMKCAEMSWKPNQTETGIHIICISAVDTSRMISDEDRCYTVEVNVETYNSSAPKYQTKPYFVEIPGSKDKVKCNVHTVCLLPLYVKSNTAIKSISAVEHFTKVAHTSGLKTVTRNGVDLYQADVAFTNDSPGIKEICAVATDNNGVSSDRTCFNAEIVPEDPCLSSPCYNSAQCKMVDTTGAYVCECSPSTSGRLCEIVEDVCHPNPCVHGQCLSRHFNVYCYCDHDFTGVYCDTHISKCDASSCNSRGACKDVSGGITCDCMEQYSGDHCETELCPNQTAGENSCSINAECSPNPCVHGVCTAGPNCTCRSGFGGVMCDTVIGTSNSSIMVEFIPSTPPKDSQMVCFKHNNNTLVPCQLMVYVSSDKSFKISTDTSPGIIAIWKLQPHLDAKHHHNVFGILVTLEGNVPTSRPYVCLTVEQLGRESEMCYSISIKSDPTVTDTSLQYLYRNATTRFVSPTWNDGSRVSCPSGEVCRLMLYTNHNNESCDDVVPTVSVNIVTVFPPEYNNNTGLCTTEVNIKVQNETDTDICFLSGFTDHQQLCLRIEEVSPSENPCISNPCLHGGRCFYDDADVSHCTCKPGYVGDYCETGPCMKSSDDCKNGGYCLSQSINNTCICRTGYAGTTCQMLAGLQSTATVPAFFYGAARPTLIDCVVNQPYRFSQLIELSQSLPYKPIVENGYVSTGLSIQANVVPYNTSFEADITLLAKQVGLHDACIQIENIQGVTDDEFCFKVNAVSDPITLYARKDRPHFVGLSLPTGTNVTCIAGEPCHVMYQVTAGNGNENDCNEVQIEQFDGFPKYHIFSTCDSCSTRGKPNSSCTVDLSIATDINDVGSVYTFNVIAKLKQSGLKGERRSFTLRIESDDPIHADGCQTLQCLNGGFCDSHIPDSTHCICRQGYSGMTCEKDKIQTDQLVDQKQTFIGDIAVPYEVECISGTTSTIPFQILGTSLTGDSKRPKLNFGYVDASIDVRGPYVDTSDNNEYIGYVKVNCTTYGEHQVCLQTGHHGTTEDELCVTVNVVGTNTRSVTDIDKHFPYFLDPTLPAESLVLCEVNTSCHLNLHYTTGDQLGLGAMCPELTETNTALDGVHIFKSDLHSHYCAADVVYSSTNTNETHKLCLQVSFPGKPGEERCFNLQVVESISARVMSPCRGHTCGNNTHSKCIANMTMSTAECVCQPGYVGPNCEADPTCNKECINGGFCDNDICFCVDGYGGEHCEIVNNPCASNPCERGLCFHHGTSFHCLCPPGYDGKTCTENVDECLSRPCLNGGVCIDGINNYTCTCSSGFTGDRCQTDVDECISSPCLHGGTCHDEVDQYSCRCTPEYKGDRCETEVNPCASNPCIHGDCYHHLLSYHCVCKPGYTGKYCQTDIDECSSTPCMNGATCVDEINQFTCSCARGYIGLLCETDINECASNPCLNGGFCHDELDQFVCHCPSGYDGVMCEKIVDPCIPNPCNSGVCYSMGQRIYCDCPPKYSGTYCEISLGLQLVGPQDVTLNVAMGSEINLNCSVTSNNPVKFMWSKLNHCEDLTNNTDGSMLIVSRNATLGSMGTYTCTATDATDPGVTKYFNVHVKVTDFSETCDFDNGELCDWKVHKNGGIDWELNNEVNSSIDGLMLYDHTTGSVAGSYLYINTTSNRDFRDRAMLESSIMPAKHTVCFEFWYYIYGQDVGEIAVTLEDTCLKKETRVMFQSGNHGNMWHKSSRTIRDHNVPNDYRILIKADIGSTTEGDVAIDDLTISDGQCKGADPSLIG